MICSRFTELLRPQTFTGFAMAAFIAISRKGIAAPMVSESNLKIISYHNN
jgi:hypothetical protein